MNLYRHISIALVFWSWPVMLLGQEFIPDLFIETGKFGYKNGKDSILVPAIYDYAENFVENKRWTVVGSGSYRESLNEEGLKVIVFKGKFGLINFSGHEIFSPQYDAVLEIFEEHAIVGKGNAELIFDQWPDDKSLSFDGVIGVVSIHGISVPILYKDVKSLDRVSNRYWLAEDGEGELHLYARGVELVLPEGTRDLDVFHQGRARIKLGDKYGYIGEDGKIVINAQFDQATSFKGNYSFVERDRQYYHIDLSGRIVDDQPEFQEWNQPSDGFSLVKIFDRYGFVRPDSSLMIYPEFTEALSFFNGVAPVKSIDEFGYVLDDGTRDLANLYHEPVSLQQDSVFLISKFPADTIRVPVLNEPSYFFGTDGILTFGRFSEYMLEAFRQAPFAFYQYPEMLAKTCAGEGTLAGRFLFNPGYLSVSSPYWVSFKKRVLLPVIQNSQLRDLAWKWLLPYYRQIFQSMPGLHQQVYRHLISYLHEYYSHYPIGEVQDQLTKREESFAYEHWDGTTSPFRKVSAQIDRLILVYKVINEKEIKSMINQAQREINTW